jgi:hypothetical protein
VGFGLQALTSSGGRLHCFRTDLNAAYICAVIEGAPTYFLFISSEVRRPLQIIYPRLPSKQLKRTFSSCLSPNDIVVKHNQA